MFYVLLYDIMYDIMYDIKTRIIIYDIIQKCQYHV
jgi:hypothetical protein